MPTSPREFQPPTTISLWVSALYSIKQSSGSDHLVSSHIIFSPKKDHKVLQDETTILHSKSNNHNDCSSHLPLPQHPDKDAALWMLQTFRKDKSLHILTFFYSHF